MTRPAPARELWRELVMNRDDSGPKLTPAARQVGIYMSLYSNGSLTREVWPTRAKIAADLGMTEKSVTRAWRDLQDVGLLVRTCSPVVGQKGTVWRLAVPVADVDEGPIVDIADVELAAIDEPDSTIEPEAETEPEHHGECQLLKSHIGPVPLPQAQAPRGTFETPWKGDTRDLQTISITN